ncbi:unnamed protein product, partial [Heterosigma akashiwo]
VAVEHVLAAGGGAGVARGLALVALFAQGQRAALLGALGQRVERARVLRLLGCLGGHRGDRAIQRVVTGVRRLCAEERGAANGYQANRSDRELLVKIRLPAVLLWGWPALNLPRRSGLGAEQSDEDLQQLGHLSTIVVRRDGRDSQLVSFRKADKEELGQQL